MSVIALALLLGVTIFFSAIIYMNTYHIVSISNAITVSQTSDGQTMAFGRTFLLDSYPYETWKTTIKEVDNYTFKSSVASAVIQWAADNSNNVIIEAGRYNLTYWIQTYRHTSLNIDQNAIFVYPAGWYIHVPFYMNVSELKEP